MFKNYIYLLRSINELKPLINCERITEIYTQEKDKLYIRIPKPTNDNFHLVISANQHLPYFASRKEHHKAKKNTKNFFTEFLPDKIEDINIALGDRIVQLVFSKSKLYFFIRGAQTNVVLINANGEFYSFKKIEDKTKNNMIDEIKDLSFINNIEPIFSSLNTLEKNEVTKKFKFIDKEIQNEIECRQGGWTPNLFHVLDDIYSGKIAVFYSEGNNSPTMIPTTFSKCKNVNDCFTFDNYSDALNKYLVLKYSIGKDKIVRAELSKYITKEIERTAARLNDIKVRMETGSREIEYENYAKMLLANIHKIKKGMKFLEIEDLATGQFIKIQLDEKLQPNQNIDKLFDKARSEKINYKKSLELYENYKNNYERLLKTKMRIESTENIDELLNIKKELKIKDKMQYQDNEERFNFRHFVLDDKYHLFVGKDSRNNDVLTTKFAKQNDYWFHARSVSGSHAVLRVENTKEAVPKNILKKAASITAFYSKSKTSKLAPVCYTLKKYVVKKKGMEPGMVALLKENVLLVTPEIPDKCIMVDD